MDTVTIDRKSLKELKRLYAASKPGEVFTFQGKEVLHDYAKYLIEYAESQLKGR